MVTGSGTTATETRPLADWSSVSLSCPGTLELAAGENTGIEIEAEDNILPLIETEVDGGRLEIRFKTGLRQARPTQPITFRAAAPRIDAIAVSGAGDVRSAPIEGDELALNVSGAGSIDLAGVTLGRLEARISGSGGVSVWGTAAAIDARVSGSGDLSARDLTCQSAKVTISGSGSVMLAVEREIEGRISGSGSIVYSGQPSVAVRTSGSGRAVRMPE